MWGEKLSDKNDDSYEPQKVFFRQVGVHDTARKVVVDPEIKR